MRRSQVSAVVSESTRKALDRYADAHGVKKGRLIEDALLHHIRALEELPADVIIPPVVVVDAESGARILERLERPSEPTSAMRRLMDRD
jgi:uncharacterized protein (DUF1778 family)